MWGAWTGALDGLWLSIESPALVLGQAGPQAAAFRGLVGLFLIVAALVALAIVTMWLKRRYLDADQRAEPVFTLEQLRQMRDRGDIGEEQFQALRTRLLNEPESRRQAQPGNAR